MGRKAFALLIAIMMIFTMAIGVCATEETETVVEDTSYTPEDSAEATEEVTEAIGEEATEIDSTTIVEVVETVDEAVSEAATEASKSIFSLTSDEIAYIKSTVENATNKAEAILAIATRFNIKVEDAEKFIDTVVEFGDKVYGEDEQWVKFKEDVFANKRFYSSLIIIGACGLVLLFVLIFVLKNGSLVKILKADRDTDMASTDEYRELLETKLKGLFNNQIETTRDAFEKQLEVLISSFAEELKGIKEILTESKVITERLEALKEGLNKLIEEFDVSKIAEIKDALTKNGETTDASLNIVHQTALHNLQLLYLIMGKTQLPIANEASRKLWYDNAINDVNRMLPSKESESDGGEA